MGRRWGVLVGCLFLLVVVVIFICERYSRWKLHQKVKKEWGKLPTHRPFDKESSLKEAWLKAKTYRSFDSEIDEVTWQDLDGFALFTQINATYSSIGSEALYQKLRMLHFSTEHQVNLEKLMSWFDVQPLLREKVQVSFACLGKKDDNYVESYLAESDRQTLPQNKLVFICSVLPILSLCCVILFPGTTSLLCFISAVLFNTLYYLINKERLNQELTCMAYLVQMLACAKKIAKISTPIILKKLATHGEEAKEVWRLLGEVESAIAILNFRKVLPITSQPTISDKLEVVGEAVYHPLLEMPVTNGVSWRKNTVVTGSNASGKSTYVKSVAISCWFSLAIHTALATKFQLPFAHLMTSMNSEDNLFEGYSYFITEINSLHRMVKKISTSEPCLCFIDEILKGTNTIERIAASSNVIYWMNQRPSLTFVVTHDSELTEILGAVCHNIHFTEQVTQDDGLTFDYRVKEGPAISRNALKLLHVTGYPCEIVEAAQQSADFFEKNHYWDKKFTAKNN